MREVSHSAQLFLVACGSYIPRQVFVLMKRINRKIGYIVTQIAMRCSSAHESHARWLYEVLGNGDLVDVCIVLLMVVPSVDL